MGYVFSAFLRSFLIQSSWNFERMQSLGFFYCIAPAIKGIHKKEDDIKRAAKRHLEFFNTNPYMAPAIIGATIRLEEDGAPDEDIKGLKTSLMGPYGAIGDSLFWGSLRPLSAIAGVSLALGGFLWAPIVFIMIYNIPHLFIRCYGIIKGYREGTGVTGAIRRLNIPDRVRWIKAGILFLAGFLSFTAMTMAEDISIYPAQALVPLSIFGFYLGMERGLRVETLAFFAVTLSVVSGLFL